MDINNKYKNRLAENELTITKQDKKEYNYTHKRKLQTEVNNFMQENQFSILNRNPTQNYKKL
jgi:hypothetical protein